MVIIKNEPTTDTKIAESKACFLSLETLNLNHNGWLTSVPQSKTTRSMVI